MTMLCSDDKHPDELLVGHINVLVRRAVERGIDVFDALQAACVNPVEHYGLNVGLLRVGDPADFIEVDSLTRVQRAPHLDRRRSSSPRMARRSFRASSRRSSTSSSPRTSQPDAVRRHGRSHGASCR